MSFYLSPEEASKVLLARLNSEFNTNGSFDYEKAAETIYGSANKRSIKDVKFALEFPMYSFSFYLIWDYIGLKSIMVFEDRGRIPNRNSGQPDREGTEDCGEGVSGSNRIRPPSQSYSI